MPTKYAYATPVSVLALVGPALAQDCFSWDSIPAGPGLRPEPAMCFDERRGVAVLFGGRDSDTWEWDGSAWTRATVPAAPAWRLRPTLTYDSRRGVAVMFGGHFGTTQNVTDETWEYYGAEWRRFAVRTPGSRARHAAAYDDVRGETVTFGGSTSQSISSDTWVWDGAQWLQRFGPGPTARYDHAMAFDRAGGVTVLHGGLETGGAWVTDTWEWDGANWMRRSAAGPGNGVMYYDSQRARVRLLAGERWQLAERLTLWEWDGAGWSEVAGLDPEWRRHPAITYDTARRAAVLYGGTDAQRRDLADGLIEVRSGLAFIAVPESRRVALGESFSLLGSTCGNNVSYQWRLDGAPLHDDGRIVGARSATLLVHGFRVEDAGGYDVVATSPVGSIISPTAAIGVYEPCYPDCDTSTGRGALDIFDFICFQNAYDAGSNYACDCDSGQFTICDIFDFLCFANAFAAGCP